MNPKKDRKARRKRAVYPRGTDGKLPPVFSKYTRSDGATVYRDPAVREPSERDKIRLAEAAAERLERKRIRGAGS